MQYYSCTARSAECAGALSLSLMSLQLIHHTELRLEPLADTDDHTSAHVTTGDVRGWKALCHTPLGTFECFRKTEPLGFMGTPHTITLTYVSISY